MGRGRGRGSGVQAEALPVGGGGSACPNDLPNQTGGAPGTIRAISKGEEATHARRVGGQGQIKQSLASLPCRPPPSEGLKLRNNPGRETRQGSPKGSSFVLGNAATITLSVTAQGDELPWTHLPLQQ